jgi:hypothetical protein
MSPRAPLLVLVAATWGCHGCRDDHPYVPYTIGAADGAARGGIAGAEAPSAMPAASATSDAGSFVAEAAVLAPAGQARWQLDGALVDAPAGSVFVSGIAADFDGDGARDVFALARPPEGSDPGQLLYYHGRPGPEPLQPSAAFAPPPTLVRNAACTPTGRLMRIGPRSAMVELGVQCPMVTNAPDRWVAVVGTEPGATVRLAATLFDPPGAPSLTVDGDVSDRDGDGRPDVALRVTLEGGGAPLEPGPRVSATLGWLDRPAGLSRDTGITEASFSALASSAMARAARAKEAPAVPRLVAQARALWRAACADGGMPRLVGVTGTGAIPCGSARALEELGLAEVRAYAILGDPLRAALAFDRAERPPAARTPSRASDAQVWMTQLAPVSAARAVRRVSAVPLAASGHELSWGALAFEPDGKLLVRTRAGPVRVDPDAGDETAAGTAADWKPGVTSPDGSMRWIETYDPCDGVALHATFATGDDLRDVALPVLPPLGDRCGGSRGAPARTLPIAWTAAGLEAIVESDPVLVSADLARASSLAALVDQPGARGSPVSPDGKTLVVPTVAGLLVRSASRSRLLRAPELENTYRDQRDCAVSNDAAHVACIRAGKAWVGTWEMP